MGSNSKLHKLWIFLLTSQHKLPSPATLSHPLKIFSLSVLTLVSQTWSLLYVVGRVTVYQVPSYHQNVLNRVLTESDSKGAEGRETPESLWENWFLHQVSWSLCVISEEMIKSGSSL